MKKMTFLFVFLVLGISLFAQVTGSVGHESLLDPDTRLFTTEYYFFSNRAAADNALDSLINTGNLTLRRLTSAQIRSINSELENIISPDWISISFTGRRTNIRLETNINCTMSRLLGMVMHLLIVNDRAERVYMEIPAFNELRNQGFFN